MKQKEYLLLSISILIIIVLWVIFNILHNYTTSAIDPNENLIVIPIEGSFDQGTINQIRNRKKVDVSLEAINQTLIASPSPSPSPIPQEIASPSSQLSPIPTQ